MKRNYYDEILKLYDSYIIFVDTKKAIVELVFDGDVKLAENISYEEFADLFTKNGNFNEESNGKMNRFLNQLNIGDDAIFTLQAKYETLNYEKVPIIVKGKKISDDKAILSFSSEYNIGNKKTDDLTRVLTKDSLIPIIKNSISNEIPFIFMIFDLDNFTSFNDKYGTMFGDILLVETAASIKRIIKTDGYVARETSDKFLILLYANTDYDSVYKKVQELRNSVINLISHNIKQVTVTATIGCASYPLDGSDSLNIYKRAYMALQRGKRKGKNCFVIYDENKCGSSLNFQLPEIQLNNASHIATNFNIISGIYEIINREGSKEKNIKDALSLIGTYFLLERINLFIMNPDTKKPMKIYQWHSPLVPAHPLVLNQNHVDLWNKSYDNTGMVKMVQVDSNKNVPVYPILKEDDVSAILAFVLKYTDIEVGLLRFEMCNSNRFWNPKDISALNLISKLFAIFMYKEYETDLFEKRISYDRLTNLYNFTKWMDVVYTYFNEHEYNDNYSIINLSYENFLHLADVLGTTAIEDALKYTAKALTKISDEEIFTRTSGDNFIIMSPSIDKDYLTEYVNKLSNLIQDKFKYGYHFKLRAGICIHNPDDNLNKTIDKSNLTRKKALEKDETILFFTEEMYEKQKIKNELELYQTKAMEKGEFKLYLQPKIDSVTNKIAGAEALTRWKYKDEKMIFPDIFIPLFEENGFIKELDLHVFENVCKFQRNVIDSGYTPVTISVNLSMYQTNLDGYFDRINEIRQKYDIPSKYLEIEITESTYVKNVNNVINLMKKLHKAGYQISMDDFGTGYSNLSSLATFDFDTIKLDKNFCSNIEGERERTILKFVVNLAKSLNINVLCEGVETKENVDFLKKIGCTLIQGYYFDKPMPANDLMEKYLKNK